MGASHKTYPGKGRAALQTAARLSGVPEGAHKSREKEPKRRWGGSCGCFCAGLAGAAGSCLGGRLGGRSWAGETQRDHSRATGVQTHGEPPRPSARWVSLPSHTTHVLLSLMPLWAHAHNHKVPGLPRDPGEPSPDLQNTGVREL